MHQADNEFAALKLLDTKSLGRAEFAELCHCMRIPLLACRERATHLPKFHKTRISSGWAFSLRCCWCQSLLTMQSWVPKIRVPLEQFTSMPEYDSIPYGLGSAYCSACGKAGPVEEHHWAPRSLFADAEMWPKSLLCHECHTRWHRVTRVACGDKAGTP